MSETEWRNFHLFFLVLFVVFLTPSDKYEIKLEQNEVFRRNVITEGKYGIGRILIDFEDKFNLNIVVETVLKSSIIILLALI